MRQFHLKTMDDNDEEINFYFNDINDDDNNDFANASPKNPSSLY